MNLNKNNINSIITRAKDMLKKAGVDEYEQDAWLLSEHVFGINRQKYYINPEIVPEKQKIDEYFALVDMRAARKPIQYIMGWCEFMGLHFCVCNDVLIPRQDTEILAEYAINTVKEMCGAHDLKRTEINVLDMCTGSGCIGISIAKYTGAAVTCADISVAALECAEKYAQKLCCENIKFIHTDLFADIHDKYDIIVSNPPYIREDEIEGLMPEVRDYEPNLALCGSADGLEFYRKITSASRRHLKDGGVIIYEIGCEQAADVSYILRENNYNGIEVIKDLAGLDRVVRAGKE